MLRDEDIRNVLYSLVHVLIDHHIAVVLADFQFRCCSPQTAGDTFLRLSPPAAQPMLERLDIRCGNEDEAESKSLRCAASLSGLRT